MIFRRPNQLLAKLAWIVGILLISAAALFLLYSIADLPNKKPNGFSRIIKGDVISDLRQKDLKYNSYYIAGCTSGSVFLGNTVAPRLIIQYPWDLSRDSLILIPDIVNFKLFSARIQIDSPSLFITECSHYGIYQSDLSKKGLLRFRQDTVLFAEATRISSSSVIVRTLANHSLDYLLRKEISSLMVPDKSNPHLLERQVDGMYSVDGQLEYDKALSMLVYVYYYRNQYICMDTSLNLIARGKLIDTNQNAKVQVATTESGHSIVLSAPPLLVNRNISVSGDNLFVVSGLLADNEDKQIFKKSFVIDVYDLPSRTYAYSFYLPGNGKDKIKSIKISGGNLVAIFNHWIISASLSRAYFPGPSIAKVESE